MEPQEHQNQWFNFGVILFGGGLVVSADWVFAVKSAPFNNHLSFTQWPIWLWIGMMAIGIWVMVASYEEKMWLPGKGRVKFAKEQRYVAEGILTFFHLIGGLMIVDTTLDTNEVEEWSDNLVKYVTQVWGNVEASAIMTAIPIGFDPSGFETLYKSLDGLIQRCTILPITAEYNPHEPVEWGPYIHRKNNEKFGNVESEVVAEPPQEKA
jgi:hypothetical protein